MADEHIYTKNGIDQSHDIVTRLRDCGNNCGCHARSFYECVCDGVEWPNECLNVEAADEIERLRAEVERLRGWIDALAPRQSYEATLCPMCHAATEYKYWANVEQHKDGCPWREAARKEARRG